MHAALEQRSRTIGSSDTPISCDDSPRLRRSPSARRHPAADAPLGRFGDAGARVAADRRHLAQSRSADVAANALFDITLVGLNRSPVASFGGPALRPQATIADFGPADIVIVPAQFSPDAAATQDDQRFAAWLRAQHAQGALLVSLAGCLLLAKAGLLDRREATGLLSEAAIFRSRFPLVRYLPSRRVVASGDIVTANGIGPTPDACAHIIERFHGAALARRFLRHTSTEALPVNEQTALWSARYNVGIQPRFPFSRTSSLQAGHAALVSAMRNRTPSQSLWSMQIRRRVEQNRLLFNRDLGPDGATSLQGRIARQNNNDVWFRRAVDACSGEGLQTINGSATAGARSDLGRAAPSVLALRAQRVPACMQTKLSTPSTRPRAAPMPQRRLVAARCLGAPCRLVREDECALLSCLRPCAAAPCWAQAQQPRFWRHCMN